MAWDFSTEPEFQEQLDWVAEFCLNEVEPLDLVFPGAVRSKDPKIRALVTPLQDQVRARGLWALFLDEELGGPGFGQLKLALLNEILGRYGSAPAIFGAQAPDTGNMEILAAHGTEEQKQRWLSPLMNQEIWSAYSMTEPEGGSDPNLFKTHAVRDGDEWVINGEKWFTSAGAPPTSSSSCAPTACSSCRVRHQEWSSSPTAPGHTATSSTTTFGCRSTTCSARRTVPRCSRNAVSVGAASTTACAPSRS